MRVRLSVIALLVFALAQTCGYHATYAQEKETQGFASLADPEQQHRCLRAAASAQKWIPKFKLSDWDITLVCGVPDEWKGKEEGLHGASSIDAPHRKGIIWFNPASEKDPELVIIHELLHFVVEEVVEAKSGLVEERAVYMISELVYIGRDN